ncbi:MULTISPECIES: Uma2 family endonuclease [unclassified Roseofilum]|uniref:Uma2 family endonuclease n=1 Tax=unclassified Roseofilum TaxID=2620099 RepID=UPI000E8EB841|nr:MULTISPECIES: Uma2 family endonuclease [unclassified Roseofilum]MBP0009328.1 Uma2 family endonuclease [Roseofilum sp. Belize Diploria]MBP0033748.1 Uma2 family endonuclease [Roseofilum sp. Belize BBD 4]HBQ98280.1 Uma2 family endonuclease [Cyanobacteria bacterium UBA11691]
MISGIATHQQKMLGEQRLTLHRLAGENYQQILQGLPESRAVRLIYDRGTLELVMPLEDHEFAAELIGVFIRVLVAAMGLKLKSMRSTTLARQDLDRGAEPDNAYYIQNQPQVAGRRVDLQKDPPPDLVVEVDITHTDIDKNQLYAALGVPEIWRYNGQEWCIYRLQGTVYQEWERSPTFSIVEKADLYHFILAIL